MKDNNFALPKEPLVFSRYHKIDLPTELQINKITQFEGYKDEYQYKENNNPQVIEWYINFADPQVFGFYGGGLFAMDEIQCSEHPILHNLREYLTYVQKSQPTEKNLIGRAEENHIPTPCLVRNVQRISYLKIDKNLQEQRPNGLYGNNFKDASTSSIEKAFVGLNQPTISHIIAMACLNYGSGQYTEAQIKQLLEIAYTSFKAAIFESTKHFELKQLKDQQNEKISEKKQVSNQEEETKFENINNTQQQQNEQKNQKIEIIIHTGNWGCGSFGNNKTIIALLQMLAAKLAGIDKLVYHCFDEQSFKKYEQGKKIFDNILSDEKLRNVKEIINHVEGLKYQWGESDFN